MSSISDRPSRQALVLFNLGTIIGGWREALGLTQSLLAQLSDRSRNPLFCLKAGSLIDLGFQRVVNVLVVQGVDLDPPSEAAHAEPWAFGQRRRAPA